MDSGRTNDVTPPHFLVKYFVTGDVLRPDHRVRCQQLTNLTTKTTRTPRNCDERTQFCPIGNSQNAHANPGALLRGLPELRGELRREYWAARGVLLSWTQKEPLSRERLNRTELNVDIG